MEDDRSKAARTLRRIAAALGTDPAGFTAPQARPDFDREAVELLRLFAGLADPAERRACLDFVRAVAARGRPT
ncbi:hypothetical protein Q8W71_22625 [Methylobacterium sp. NEAU 140]|uniref:hypothetical protein n=1 Tax=Methylobacterium sp. NEAU 140 TaxID=3064945 RepID=UPI00273560A5|nr:hypothetical protein [Methylobacterium sp. NEAU 140]MDP4025431.1 hypothetical protein [Methylobacterium sp. NEAU 140]